MSPTLEKVQPDFLAYYHGVRCLTANPDAATLSSPSSRPIVDQLAEQLGVDWPHLQRARQLSERKRQELRDQLMAHDADDTTIVVFGSLARNEFTDGSDIDWTFLVDGSADPQHTA